MEVFDLNEGMQQMLEVLELDIAKKKAVIHLNKLPALKGYRRQLQQMFHNLLSNGLKYSKAGIAPQIHVAGSIVTENGNPYHLITVEDNGIGFDQDYAAMVFQIFTLLHGKGEYSGMGVGLSIVKKVVGNHNGRIIFTFVRNSQKSDWTNEK